MNGYDSFGDVLRINVFLLMTVACTAIAYLIWPTSLEWAGLGLLSLFVGASGLQFLMMAVGLMRKVHRNNKVFRSYQTKRSNPKSARLTGDDDLRDAGMM
jgi:hypothetical protein